MPPRVVVLRAVRPKAALTVVRLVAQRAAPPVAVQAVQAVQVVQVVQVVRVA